MFSTRIVALIIIVAFLIAGCANSPAGNSPGIANSSEPRRIASVDVVKADLEEVALHRGGSADALVRLSIQSGYHVNANPPSYPYLKATEIELGPTAGISVAYITYPEPLTKKFSFAENPLAVYEGETLIKVRIKADKSAKPGVQNLSGKLRVQACDDQVCYAPGTLDVSVPVNVK